MTCGVLLDVFFSRTFFSFANENYSGDVDTRSEKMSERERRAFRSVGFRSSLREKRKGKDKKNTSINNYTLSPEQQKRERERTVDGPRDRESRRRDRQF